MSYPPNHDRSQKSLKYAFLDDRSKFAIHSTFCGTKGPFEANFIRLFFSKLSTCLQYAGDSRQHESKKVIYVTLRDGLSFPTVNRLVDSSVLGLPMDYLGPIACDSLAIQLITESTSAWDVLH